MPRLVLPDVNHYFQLQEMKSSLASGNSHLLQAQDSKTHPLCLLIMLSSSLFFILFFFIFFLNVSIILPEIFPSRFSWVAAKTAAQQVWQEGNEQLRTIEHRKPGQPHWTRIRFNRTYKFYIRQQFGVRIKNLNTTKIMKQEVAHFTEYLKTDDYVKPVSEWWACLLSAGAYSTCGLGWYSWAITPSVSLIKQDCCNQTSQIFQTLFDECLFWY